MALRIRKIQVGTYKGGRFTPRRNPPKLAKLGSGKRFERCLEQEIAKGTALDPRAVCAVRGIKKYGKKRMGKLARAGKKRHRHNSKRRNEELGNYKAWEVLIDDRVPLGYERAYTKAAAQKIANRFKDRYANVRIRQTWVGLKSEIHKSPTPRPGFRNRKRSARARTNAHRHRKSRKAPKTKKRNVMTWGKGSKRKNRRKKR